MREPNEELKDIMGRDGWGLLLEKKQKFLVDLMVRLSSSARSNDGRHQLYQGKIDGINEFFDSLIREVEKKAPTAGEKSQGQKEIAHA